jgi:class 3 adenylate cyclase/CHASE3 domain sensor protein
VTDGAATQDPKHSRKRLIGLGNPLVGLVARAPLRLETKLLAAFLAIVALLIVLGAVGHNVLSGAHDRTAELIKLERKIAAYRQIQYDTTSQLYHVSAALFAAEDRALDSTLRQLGQIGYDLDRVQFVAADEIELLARVREEYERFVAVVTRLVELIRLGRVAEGHDAQTKEAQPIADSLERLTNQLVNKAEADMVGGIDASEEAYRNSRAIVIGFVMVSIALALFLGRTISLSLVGPISDISARLSRIAQGDFEQRIAVANRDELGGLAVNVNRTSEQLGQLYDELRAEQQRSEALLLNTLPRPILERLRRGETVIADRITAATILFSDIVDFTELAGRLPPERMIEMLGTLFARFDALAAKLGLEKIKTIGDGYMVASGVPEPRADHAAAAAEMALAMLAAADAIASALGEQLRLRIGLHSGPLIAGVIGTTKFVYDVWGDTVNTASRMEKLGLPGRIHVSAATRDLLGVGFRLERRGAIAVKGKGPMETYFLEPHPLAADFAAN